jgi:hypothetical protein
MSLVSGTRDGRKVYANVCMYLLRQPNPDVGGQVNDSVRRTRLDGAEQFRIDRVDGDGRKKLCNSFLGRPRRFVAVKDRGGRGEKEFFRESFESIKKLMKSSACARSMAGRQRAEDLVLKEGRWADRGSVVREAQKPAIGMLRRLVLGLSFPGMNRERGRGRADVSVSADGGGECTDGH